MSSAERTEEELLERAGAGDRTALNELFLRHRERLRWMVQLRLNRKLQGRINASDVVQEACLAATKRLAHYLARPRLPFFLWLRSLTGKQLLALHRRHLNTHMRAVGREARANAAPEVSAAGLAAEIVGRLTTASAAAVRAEAREIVQRALAAMDPLDREVLVLRHFEMLSNDETAHELGIGKSAASNRYVRALRRLKEILVHTPGFCEVETHA